jgi:hypothetical protein
MTAYHTIGDSHSTFGWLEISNESNHFILRHHLGAMTCYRFGIEKLNIFNFDIADGDVVIFCFGEIDCRCHVHKHVSETRTYQHVIDEIVKNYFDAIVLNILHLKSKLKHVCVFNVVPLTRRNECLEDIEYPFLGTDEERKEYVLYFNKKIKKHCIENDYLFFDVFDKYADENGFFKKHLTKDKIHIGDSIYIREFLEKNL